MSDDRETMRPKDLRRITARTSGRDVVSRHPAYEPDLPAPKTPTEIAAAKAVDAHFAELRPGLEAWIAKRVQVEIEAAMRVVGETIAKSPTTPPARLLQLEQELVRTREESERQRKAAADAYELLAKSQGIRSERWKAYAAVGGVLAAILTALGASTAVSQCKGHRT